MDKNKHTAEEIITSLQIIKEACSDYEECESCPMGDNNGRCLVSVEAPENWNVVEKKAIIRFLY